MCPLVQDHLTWTIILTFIGQMYTGRTVQTHTMVVLQVQIVTGTLEGGSRTLGIVLFPGRLPIKRPLGKTDGLCQRPLHHLPLGIEFVVIL